MEIQNELLRLTQEEFNSIHYLRKVLTRKAKDNARIPLLDPYKDLFYEYKPYTLEEIMIEIINDNSIPENVKSTILNKKMLHDSLILLAILGEIVIIDNLDEENEYKYVSKCLKDSAYTNSFSEINIGSCERVILISDTHIGNSEIEDFDMINDVINYAKRKYGINIALHLGDVFEGVRLDKGKYNGYPIDSKEIQQTLDSQLEKFSIYYPKNIKTIAVAGNHDENIINYLKSKNYLGHSLNHLYLSMINPNFHMIQRNKRYKDSIQNNQLVVNGQNIRINLSHPLTFNMFYPYVKTNEIEESGFSSIFKDKNPTNIDLFISGHFHFNMNYNILDDNNITQRRYEVIPSLSRLNQETEDKCASKIIRFIRDNLGNITHYGITPLYYINNKVIEGEEIVYPTNNSLKSKKYYNKKA